MFGINYFKADSSTYVIKTSGSRVLAEGKGLSFFYNAAATSVAALPVNTQESPFIFSLQSADYQSVKVQGQVSWHINNPRVTADMLNFNLNKPGTAYASEDPVKLGDRVVRTIQAAVQARIQETNLRSALLMNRQLNAEVLAAMDKEPALASLGLRVLNVVISSITPTPETSKALEAEAREALLKQADDALYSRRKAAVEQERTIKEAELETDLSVQQKKQEIAASRIENERALMRSQAEMAMEKLQSDIASEQERQQFVKLNSANNKEAADVDAYAIRARMQAYATLPVESLKALTMAGMEADQLLASAIETFAINAGKIGELNLGPDLFSSLLNKAGK